MVLYGQNGTQQASSSGMGFKTKSLNDIRRAGGSIRWECRRSRLKPSLECESQRHLNLPRAADGVDRLSQTGRALIEEAADEWTSAIGRTLRSRGNRIRRGRR